MQGGNTSREEWDIKDGAGSDAIADPSSPAEEPTPATVPTGGPLSAKDYKSRLQSSEGTQTVIFPTTGFTIRYAHVTLRGLYPTSPDKANQDSLCALPQFAGDPEQALFGVFDGRTTLHAHACMQHVAMGRKFHRHVFMP